MYTFHTVGSSLDKCTFNGLQCCSSFTIGIFGLGVETTINSYGPNIVSGFAAARNAINQLRSTNEGMTIVTYYYKSVCIQ